MPFATIIGAAVPVFILLIAGFGLRRCRILTEEADASILKLVVTVLYPCLYLNYIVGNPALKGGANLITAPLVGFVTTAGGFLLAYGVARLLSIKAGKGLRTFTFCNGIYNYGFIPIPVIMVLFGDRETLGVLLVHNVGVEAAIWTIGIMMLSGQFKKSALRRLFNPPLVALLVALGINFLGLDGSIPTWLSTPVEMLAACCIPLGILTGGACIADLLASEGIFEMPRIGLGSLAVRLCLLPLLFMAGAAFIPGLSTELRQVIVIQAAMPAGIMPIVLSRHYGGDVSIAVRIVIATTIASIITMPLWIGFGTAFVL